VIGLAARGAPWFAFPSAQVVAGGDGGGGIWYPTLASRVSAEASNEVKGSFMFRGQGGGSGWSKAGASWLMRRGFSVRNGWQKLNDGDLEPSGFSGTVEPNERRGANVSAKCKEPKRPNPAVKGTWYPQARRGAAANSAPRRACGHHAPYL